MQGSSTCLSGKSIAHIVRKLHEIHLLEKVSSSGLAFYIEIGSHWKYPKLLRGMNLLETTPFVLQNTAGVHFEVVHGYSLHTERHSRKNPTNPEMQLAWMSGSQHQFFCSTNLFEWHHNTCQHRQFFHQYPVKTIRDTQIWHYQCFTNILRHFPGWSQNPGGQVKLNGSSSYCLQLLTLLPPQKIAPHFAAGMLQTIWISWLLLVYNRSH